MNNLFLETVLITLVAFIGYMHSYWGSTMNNRPIIIGPLTGLVLGNLEMGLMVGAALELAFLGAVPIGASNPPDMTSGTVIGTAFVIISGQDIGTAVALAIPVATLVGVIDNLLMMFVLTQAGHMCDAAAEKGDYRRIEWITRFAGIGNKVVLALVVGIGYYLGIPVIEQLLTVIPDFILRGMDVAAGLLPAVGFAMLARMILTKELSPYLLAGFVLAAYFNAPVLGVTLCGLVVAGVVFFNDSKKNSTKEVSIDDNEF